MVDQTQRANWMVVYVTYHIHEAQIIAGRLKSDGIQAVLHQAPGASALGIHIGSLGEVKVLVHPADYALATAILFPDEPEQLADDNKRIIFEDGDTDE